jgi:hypothetical protein
VRAHTTSLCSRPGLRQTRAGPGCSWRRVPACSVDDFGWANVGYHRTSQDDPNHEVATRRTRLTALALRRTPLGGPPAGANPKHGHAGEERHRAGPGLLFQVLYAPAGVMPHGGALGVSVDPSGRRAGSPTRSSLQSGRLPVHVNILNIDPNEWNPQDPISGFQGWGSRDVVALLPPPGRPRTA